MDLVAPISELIARILGCISPRISQAEGLENNLSSLRCATEELRDLSKDVEKRIELAEQQQVVRKRKVVEGWLQRAQVVEQEASRILQRGEVEIQSNCFWGWCPRSYCSRFKVGGKVEKMLVKVKEERSKGFFEVVADELPYLVVEERPLENTVGLDLMFLQAWEHINDGKVGILGLYGLGGVGKTTLLTKINNEFINQRHDFKLVIWVAMVKQAQVEDVQQVIHNRLNLKDLNWHRKSRDEKAAMIYKFLKGKKFVLLLDDIWERLNLSQVGIPLPNANHGSNKGKIVFTTRSQEVCSQMEAQKRIKVTCLAQCEAITLFNSKVGEETLNSHPEIRELAQGVAEECGGLPLALITIGRAMSDKKDPWEWRRAIAVLRDSPAKFSGMRDHVFPVLRFSYDSLNDETVKQCFLYCSIFAEDYDILKENLVELWIGEGLIKESDDIYEARNLGFDIIQVLKSACLLETSGDRVKMHDVIRDMALWIACQDGNKWRNKMILEQHTNSIDATRIGKWIEAERIGAFGATTIYGSPTCPNLLTLLLRDCKLVTFPCLFFHHMPMIRVLDLSNNSELSDLPIEISLLVSLQYIDLSNTKIESLPEHFRNLTQMRHLLLDFTKDLRLIPIEVISRFSHLRVLSMNRSCSDDCLDEITQGNVLSAGRELLLQELEHSENLQDLRVTLTSLNSVTRLLSSDKLRRSTRQLRLKRCTEMAEITVPFSSMEQMVNLEKVEIRNCRSLNLITIQRASSSQNKNGFRCLSSVTISDCLMVEMNWLMHAPALEFLHLQACKLLEVVLSDSTLLSDYERHQRVFSKLTTITLFDLPKLESLSPQALPFPLLEKMRVTLCPSLRKLPFSCTSGQKTLREILAWPSWWDQLEWEDDSIEPIFRAHFKPSN